MQKSLGIIFLPLFLCLLLSVILLSYSYSDFRNSVLSDSSTVLDSERSEIMGESETRADKEGGGEGDGGVQPKTEAEMSRKEKRKAVKKMKRKEIALKVRQEEEARPQDPQELINMEQEEAKRSESVRIMFEERERAWIEAMDIRKKKRIEQEEDERRIKALEDEELSRKQQIKNANDDGDDDWEYVEVGPAEIIWKENEVIVKKKRVKVPKRNKDQQSIKEDSD